jgi:hypothetical protein
VCVARTQRGRSIAETLAGRRPPAPSDRRTRTRASQVGTREWSCDAERARAQRPQRGPT